MENIPTQEKLIVQSLLSMILNDETLSQPIYCPEVQTEQDAEKLSSLLPLVYIWNENTKVGSISISINGPLIGSLLEQKLPRSNNAFGRVRDEIMQALKNASQIAIVATCQRMGAMPSVVFARKIQDEIKGNVFNRAMATLIKTRDC